MNPMPVATDKVSLALELYSVPVLFLASCSYETGELLQTSNLGCDDIPLCSSHCSSPCTRGGFLCSAATPHLLAWLENGKLTPCKYLFRLAQLLDH